MPAHMMQPSHSIVTADGLRLSASSFGTGPARVIVPNGAYFADSLASIWRRHPALVYDLRNRGASDPIADLARKERGILHDVEDLETVRRSLGTPQVDLVAHSYVGVPVMLYAVAHPAQVRRVVLLSPAPPDASVPPPPPDATARRVFARIGELMTAPAAGDATARCTAVWEVLAELYVADPAHAAAVRGWGRCDLPNERSFQSHWTTHVEPSLRRATFTDANLARVLCPVLVVHGTADRSAPFSGGRDWARRLPDARLLTLDGVAHAPWIERREVVLDALTTFLDGAWPATARTIPK